MRPSSDGRRAGPEQHGGFASLATNVVSSFCLGDACERTFTLPAYASALTITWHALAFAVWTPS